MSTQFICALSGIKASEDEFDELEFPDGWIEVRLTKRYVNPKWDAIQYVKAGLVQQYLNNVPEEHREEQIMAITIQVEAQFATIESQTEQYVEEETIKYIANPDTHKAIAGEYAKFRKFLGIKKPKVVSKPVEPPKPPVAEPKEEASDGN